ncbi:MAG: glycosyltransferase family 4 protein [Bdellovibrionales bacterium]|jgi:UDP-N-acetylmuramyl pentapeptide phosphotransferase/UDP-N-acetylglucosamine-1-phosphate transferase
MSPFTPIILTAFLVSALLTRWLKGRLIAKAMMDVPNERSMHTTPVPRGGGLAMMAVIVVGMVATVLWPFVIAITNGIPSSVMPAKAGIPFLFLIASVLLLMGISWLDDRKSLRASLRLSVHLLAALIGSFALGDHATLFGAALPFWLDRAVMVLGWAWFMNLYNFMDGIDGLTATQTIAVVTGVASFIGAIASLDPQVLLTGDMALCSLIIGASAGFLVYNWHPAKLFMGDVGSVPLGFLVAYLLIKMVTLGLMLPALLLPLYYLADSGITITRRALRGEKFWQAHRQHFYQRAALGEGSPKPVVYKIIAANVALFGAALLSMATPWLGLSVGVLIIVVLLASLSKSAQKVRKP